jgi:pyridoxal phosphate enzyme (YggS family)
MNKASVQQVYERITRSCRRAERAPETVTVVAVSKGRPVADIQDALAAGFVNIGENRVQEARMKYAHFQRLQLSPPALRWHMVGHLQTNKVKDAVTLFDLIQSVDSMRLAQEIDKCAAQTNKIQDVLLEVKVSPEEAKGGVAVKEASAIAQQIRLLPHIALKGLMTVAPLCNDAEETRPFFKMLRSLFDAMNKGEFRDCPLPVLSMGMSDDFEVAIEEGATMVRLGRALFEASSGE